MTSTLKEKVAIITGANQGLGLEIALRYAEAGASLVICARNGDLLAEARQALAGKMKPGQGIEAIQADVSVQKDVEELVRVALRRFGQIDILVNNAGIYGPMCPIEQVDWAQWMKALQINLFGSVMMCRAVLPAMKEQGRGKIIQLGGAGAHPMPYFSAYTVSKAGIVRFVETLAAEVREFNIYVNAVAPGALNTRMLDEVLEAGPDKAGQPFFDESVKQKESGGAGLEKAARLAAFLASDASNGITGKIDQRRLG